MSNQNSNIQGANNSNAMNTPSFGEVEALLPITNNNGNSAIDAQQQYFINKFLSNKSNMN